MFFRPTCRKILAVVVIFILYYFGVITYIIQSSFDNFEYPLNEDIAPYVDFALKQRAFMRKPINSYNYSFTSNCDMKCSVEGADLSLRLVYIVKSSPAHFKRRQAIRRSWGFERRFSDVEIRTVFVLGRVQDEKLQREIDEEIEHKGDIVQADFMDSYYNNTIKTMMGMTWAVKFCPQSKFYFFSDDDFYISTKNLLKFARNPLHYPKYLQMPQIPVKSEVRRKRRRRGISGRSSRHLNQILDIDLPDDAELYAGYVFPKSAPQRHHSSKWYISLAEYPYDRYPSYVTAGAFLLSNRALQKFYYGSFYTKHFRFDDVYLGLVARKVNIAPVHSEEFYFTKKPFNVPDYRYVIASHGYDDPEEVQTVWHEMKSAGAA